MQVSVLYGGDSAEREVSLKSGVRACAGLRAWGHEVIPMPLCGEPSAREIALMKRADAVFLALHGGAGEDGRLQALLERNGIFHYTGSGPAAAALAMHKERAKACVRAAGVPTANGVTLSVWQREPPLPYPFVCKPLCGGSSLGLSFIYDHRDWQKLAPLGHFSEEMLCEELLSGREFTVTVLQSQALPAVEIRPLGGAYDYHHKYTVGASEELCPAPVAEAERARLRELALTAFRALDLRDYARIDLKESAPGKPCFLEANALPGMTETSLMPLSAKAAGLSFPALCDKMARLAGERKKT